MIDALDHLKMTAAADIYEALLGRCCANGRLQTTNVGMVFDGSGAPLSSMVFAVTDLEKAARLVERRGVPTAKGATRELAKAATHGVPIALIERNTEPVPSPPTVEEASAISALDHVVIRSPNPERAVAFYAGRLGLDLRLDRSNPAWGARLLFFRCGDLVVEVAHDLAKGISDGPDQLWRLSWRTPDIAKTHARLKAAGVDVSEMRDGRRPGSQVFTVRSHTANVPTLVIGGIGRW